MKKGLKGFNRIFVFVFPSSPFLIVGPEGYNTFFRFFFALHFFFGAMYTSPNAQFKHWLA